MDNYMLAPHVHATTCGNDVVVLNLRADQYLSFSASGLAELPFFIHGLTTAMPVAGVRNRSSLSLENTLFEQGLLVPCKDADDIPRPTAIEAVSAEIPQPPSLDEGPVRARLSSNPKLGWAFGTAWRSSESRFRRLPMYAIVEQLARDRPSSQDPDSIDTETLEPLLATFNGFRALTYTSANRCLFDTHVLIQFLHHFHMRPRWVFGVQTDPFAAHCWAQIKRTVINDRLVRVNTYSPIMVI